MKIGLVIPCFLRTQQDVFMLTRLLESTKKQSKGLDSIFVIDDASPLQFDYSAQNVEIAHQIHNGGPAIARNLGIQKALDDGCSHILFTDHDCILHPNWTKEITTFLDSEKIESAGGLTLAYGKTLIDKFHDTNGTLNGRFILPERKHLLYAPTCNYGMTAKVGREFNFDTKYPNAAGEDVNFCIRVREKYPIGFCPTAIVNHDFGYKNSFQGIPRLINMFRKYKDANTLLYHDHPEYFDNSWFGSAPITTRDVHVSHS